MKEGGEGWVKVDYIDMLRSSYTMAVFYAES